MAAGAAEKEERMTRAGQYRRSPADGSPRRHPALTRRAAGQARLERWVRDARHLDFGLHVLDPLRDLIAREDEAGRFDLMRLAGLQILDEIEDRRQRVGIRP